LAEADPHVNHAAARQEWLARDEHAYLLSAVQVEFTAHRDMRPRYYAALPPRWSEVEVPFGFPACMPRYVAYFATALQPGDHFHRAFSILATNWMIGVASTWYAVVRNRGRLWHLSASLVAAIRSLGPAELAAGRDGDAVTLLASMLALHDHVGWGAAVSHLRRNRMAPGKEPDTRGFVHFTKGLEDGELRLCEGLGRGDYPYADRCGPTKSPPPSGWDAVDKTTPAFDGGRGSKGSRTSGSRRGGRGAPGRTRGGYHDLDAPSSCVAGPSFGGSSRAYSARASPWFGAAPSRRRDPPSFAMVEPFPLRHLRGGLSREPLPQSVARVLQEMLPAVAPVIWDTAGEVTLVALADTVGWLSRRLASFAAQVRSADESSAEHRLLEETALPAVGAHFVARLEEHRAHLAWSQGGGYGPTAPPAGHSSTPQWGVGTGASYGQYGSSEQRGDYSSPSAPGYTQLRYAHGTGSSVTGSTPTHAKLMQAWEAQRSTVPGVPSAPDTFRRGSWGGPSGAHRDASPRRDGQGHPGDMEP